MKGGASPARAIALKVLRQVEEKGAFANHLLEAAFRNTDISQPDRSLTYLLTYGVLRHRNRLDRAISHYSHYPVERLTPWIRNILRLGAYQIIEMPDSRHSVAVDESVRLAHKYGHRGTVSLVNAVLRKIASEGEMPLPSFEENPHDYLVCAQSHPQWLIKRWLARYGPSLTREICCANNQPPPLTIRLNKLKGGDNAALIESMDTPEPSTLLPEAVFIQGPRPITAHPFYMEGRIDLQGLSSMLIAHVLAVRPGDRVLDVCAGSGGKSCHMADLMKNQGHILCMDNNKKKIRALSHRARRLGAAICSPLCSKSDMDIPLKGHLFDRVLADAPCSSMGVIRRHPEIRWLRKEQDLYELSGMQKAILEQAAKLLRPGGRLVYCTCSLEPEETDEVMEDFLTAFPTFSVIDLKEEVPPPLREMVGEDGVLRLLPSSLPGIDGFFVFSVTK